MKKISLIFLLGVFFTTMAVAQEMLPDFSVYKVGTRVVVAWTHNYPDIKQISVQRSHDSLNYFKTIGSPPDPSIQQNGLADPNPPSDSMFYRIFIMFEGGRFTATASKRPSVDTLGLAGAYSSANVGQSTPVLSTNFLPTGFTPSRYIFTSPDRYVRVELPMDNRKYTIKFFDENYQPLFELNDIKEKRFKLDRSYFYKAGFVNFELYANGTILEKYKVYLPKDF